MNFNHLAKAAMAAACLAAGALPASADNIMSAAALFPQTWIGNGARQLVLRGGGEQILQIPVPVTGTVSVTYTAECRLNADTGSFMFVTILIDNQPMTPTGPGDAFCSGRSGAVGGGAARRSITVSRGLAAGSHQIRVLAQVTGPHLAASIRTSTLVIEQ